MGVIYRYIYILPGRALLRILVTILETAETILSAWQLVLVVSMPQYTQATNLTHGQRATVSSTRRQKTQCRKEQKERPPM